MTKEEFEALAQFRYELRRFLRFSEQATHTHGVTPLHYLLLLQIKGYPGRDWATITELAERLQAKHHGVVSLVTRCEEAGLVRRSTSTEDRRRVEVRVTANGATTWAGGPSWCGRRRTRCALRPPAASRGRPG